MVNLKNLAARMLTGNLSFVGKKLVCVAIWKRQNTENVENAAAPIIDAKNMESIKEESVEKDVSPTINARDAVTLKEENIVIPAIDAKVVITLKVAFANPMITRKR